MDEDIYRSRLDIPLGEKVMNYLSSLKDDLWILEEDIIGTQVHNIMLYEEGIIKEDEAREILKSLEKIKNKFKSNELILDEKYEDIHPFIEDSVIKEIGIEKGGKLHTGRSRNDQVSVDIRLKIRKELNFLTSQLFALFESIESVSKKTNEAIVPLYTHLQRGQLGVFSHYFNNYLSQIIRNINRIEEVYARINMNPLGACAIGGTSIRINRERTTELLGFEDIVYNSIDAISSRDYIHETLSLLSLISLQFSRMTEDLLLWSSKEFDFIELSDKYCSVSSVMPQKKNPDTLELTRSKCAQIISNSFNSSLIIKSIPTGYFRDFQDLKPLIIDSFSRLHMICDILKGIFSSLKINFKKMKEAVEDSYILALDLAELLVQEFKIPFRKTHNIVGSLVKNSKKPLDLLDSEKIENILRKYDKDFQITESQLAEIKNFKKCLSRRKSKGSPSQLEIKSLLKKLNSEKKRKEKDFQLRLKKLREISDLRNDIIRDLIEK